MANLIKYTSILGRKQFQIKGLDVDNISELILGNLNFLSWESLISGR